MSGLFPGRPGLRCFSLRRWPRVAWGQVMFTVQPGVRRSGLFLGKPGLRFRDRRRGFQRRRCVEPGLVYFLAGRSEFFPPARAPSFLRAV